MIDTATDPWGIDIERVEVGDYLKSSDCPCSLFSLPPQVKDVRLPQNLQRAMAAEAEATREARAKVARGEGIKDYWNLLSLLIFNTV